MQSIAADLTYALDVAAWCRHRLNFEPDAWQADVLKSNSDRILLNCSRQSGKTHVASALALHVATFQPGSLILCLSPTLRQSSELFHTVRGFYDAEGHSVPAVAESALKLELENKSRIISLPGQEGSIRGYSAVSLLIVDEAARVPDDLYYSVRPMLAVSGGRIIALSTPWGCRGWFYEAWRDEEAWQRFEVPASKCPRISAAFLEEERRTLGSYWFEQEYMCKFLDSEAQLFRHEDIEAMFSEEVAAWNL